MTVKVFVWLPNAGNVGHTAMQIGEDLYISFWPDKAKKSFAASIVRHLTMNVVRSPLYQDYLFDREKNGFEPIITELEYLKEEEIREYWSKVKDSEVSYKLAEFNCSTVIANSLYIGSGLQPSFRPLADLDTYIGLGIPLGEIEAWEPKTILQYAKEIKRFQTEKI